MPAKPRAPALRSVGASASPRRRAVSVAKAAEGSRRDLLLALRARIARSLDSEASARDLAALSRRLLDIAKEIDALDAAEGSDDVGAAAATPDEEWAAT